MTVRPPSLKLSDLKKIKNIVIGNPSAKVQYARDEVFIRTLVQSLNNPPPSLDPQSSQDDIRVEVAHIIASLSYGSDRALTTLIHANALGALLLAISNFRPAEQPSLRAAFARALRALGVAIADIVGPALWGLRPDDSEVKGDAKQALDASPGRLPRHLRTPALPSRHRGKYRIPDWLERTQRPAQESGGRVAAAGGACTGEQEPSRMGEEHSRDDGLGRHRRHQGCGWMGSAGRSGAAKGYAGLQGASYSTTQ